MRPRPKTVAGKLCRRDAALVPHGSHDRGVRRPLGADRVLGWVPQVLRLVAGCGDDHHASLLRIPCRLLQVEQHGPLTGIVGAEVQVRIGKQADVDDIQLVVACVPQGGSDGIGEAEAGDGARLQPTTVACGATPAIPMPFDRPAIVVAT